MITKNYYVARRTYDTNTGTSTSISTNPYKVTTLDGTEDNAIFASISQGRCLWTASRLSVHLGTGTTPEDAEDYCLDNDITSTLSGVQFNVQTSVTLQGSRYCYQSNIAITFSNQTGADVVITEVGVAAKWAFNNGGKDILIFRKVINPVNVANNQSTTIVLNWFDF